MTCISLLMSRVDTRIFLLLSVFLCTSCHSVRKEPVSNVPTGIDDRWKPSNSASGSKNTMLHQGLDLEAALSEFIESQSSFVRASRPDMIPIASAAQRWITQQNEILTKQSAAISALIAEVKSIRKDLDQVNKSLANHDKQSR